MTHLVKMLSGITSSRWWANFNEIYSVKRGLTTSSYHFAENEPLFLNQIPLNENEQAKPSKKRRKKYFDSLVLKPNLLQNVRSVIGISVTTFSVAWAKIDLEEMRLVSCMSVDVKREKTDCIETFTYKKAKIISSLLPESDLYIFERCIQKKIIEDFTFNIMIMSMLTTFLYNATGPLEENIFFQNPQVIDKLYQLTVNKERVSCGQALQRMLNNTVVEQINSGESDITICIKNTTFIAKREIVNSLLFSKPATSHAHSIALFIVLSFISSNPALKKLDPPSYEESN